MSGASSNCWAIKWLRPLGWHQNDAGVHAFDRYPTRLRRNDRADALARWLDERPPVSGVLPKLHPRLEALQYLDFTSRTSRPWDALIEVINITSRLPALNPKLTPTSQNIPPYLKLLITGVKSSIVPG